MGKGRILINMSDESHIEILRREAVNRKQVEKP